MKFTALYHSVSREHQYSLHAAGCKDVEREARKHGSTVELVVANTLEGALDYVIDEELTEMGYCHDDVKVHNCAKQLARTNGAIVTRSEPVTTMLEAAEVLRGIATNPKVRISKRDRRGMLAIASLLADRQGEAL